MFKKRVGVVAAVTIAVLAGAAASPAGAVTPPTRSDDPDHVAALIEDVAPQQGVVLEGSTGQEVVSGASVVSIPLDPAQPVALTGGGHSNALDVAALKVHVASAQALSQGDQAEDGTVVFAGETSSLAVQALSDGSVRIQTIIEEAAPVIRFEYTFGDDVSPVAMGDGTVELHREAADGLRMVVGVVDAPWAVDAEGRPVETNYEVFGQSLVQVVEPTAGAIYPVVADPKITRTWWNTTVYFDRSESLMIAAGASGVAAVAALIPDVTLSKAVAAAAGLAAAYASLINASGSCIKFVYYAHRFNIWQPYGGSEAGGYCQ